MKNFNLTYKLLVASLVIVIFGCGYKLGELQTKTSLLPQSSIQGSPNPTTIQDKKNIDFALFWTAWDTIQKKFVDKKKIDPQKMYYGAIKGMVASLEDPYTFFLTPDENKQSKDDLGGRCKGIGAQLGLKEGRITVVAPLKASPAENAGIKSGDYINKVDDVSTSGWNLTQTVSKIRGVRGTQVALTLERNGKEFELEIIRDVIKVSSIDLSYEHKKDCTGECKPVAHLKLNQFGEQTNDEWDTAVDEIVVKWQNTEISGMVLDMRDNPGGYLDGSVYLAAEFLPMGKLVVKQESTAEESHNYVIERKGKLLNIPLVVLINKGSASAAEILAGALRDYKRAQLVGEKSFGKGSVQEALDLGKGAGLHVTVAKWILPKGDWINSKGIEPDVKIENKITDGNTLTRETDVQLDKAIELILK